MSHDTFPQAPETGGQSSETFPPLVDEFAEAMDVMDGARVAPVTRRAVLWSLDHQGMVTVDWPQVAAVLGDPSEPAHYLALVVHAAWRQGWESGRGGAEAKAGEAWAALAANTGRTAI